MFTVIIPCYNPKFTNRLEQNLEMLRENVDCNSLEVFLIDDHSKDRSYLSKFEKFNFVKIIRNDRNVGKARSINKIVPKTQNDYLCILDDDDEMTIEGVRERIDFVKNKKNDVLIGSLEIIKNGEAKEIRKVPNNRRKLLNQLLSGLKTPFHLNSVLFKKTLFESIDGMDPTLLRAQDVDLSMKILKVCKSFKTSEKIHYRYYKHRNDYKSIIKLRLKTIYFRYLMIRNNTNGIEKYYHSVKSFFVDLGKLLYSIIFRY